MDGGGHRHLASEAMSSSPLLSGLPAEHQEELLSFLDVAEVKAHEVILDEGQAVKALFLLGSGEVTISGQDGPAFTLRKGGTFGMSSMGPNSDVTICVRAETDAVLFAVHARDLPRVPSATLSHLRSLSSQFQLPLPNTTTPCGRLRE
jgi:signal-transduction protein with cAMP-binding, CBS, and nucleotidyltransferase domain